MVEQSFVWGGVAAYTVGTGFAWHLFGRWRANETAVLGFVTLGVGLFGSAIVLRWLRTGYGPFLTMFDILLSNLFSVGLIYALVYWLVRESRIGAAVAMPFLLLLGYWILTVSVDPIRLPATYDNRWLWMHVGVGKLFLGSCLVGVSLAGALLVDQGLGAWGRRRLIAQAAAVDNLVWRFMSVAFVFHSLMLVAGAVWAQDAWGRYWAWDPLETWAFITWLVLGLTLHLRLAYELPPWVGWILSIAVFILAFLTFFGVPFLSLAPHKGVM